MLGHAQRVRKGKGVMEYAVCYDHSGTALAWSIFLDITAFFLIMAAFAAARLIAISRADSVEPLQIA
ncbi:hypothetical protein RFN28_19965 [Mesorhizobium sp. VK24D]|uniref:Uncharacterized protein n=1 Tax=Mesorhizobium album TaxID=3072314 RepID=A0ABU4Y1Z9_9HYPH|nr:hypothetical protein [Mesorhizobium sp. VK24D]MDX8480726.1 hypothetical protein [Mesorhizobium sp. VK24D]